MEEGIALVRARRGLELTRQREQILRATVEEEAITRKRKAELEIDAAADAVRNAVAQMDVARARNAALEIDHAADLARRRASEDLALQGARSQQELTVALLAAEVEATVKRFGAAQGGFSEALLALSSRETLAKVAEAMSVQSFVGGKTLVDVVSRIFEGTPLADVMGRIAARSAGNGTWHATDEEQ